MSYQTVTAILNLISTIYLQSLESGLITQLNNFYSFDHNIILINSTVDVNRFIDTNVTECTPKTIHTFKNFEDAGIALLNPITEINSKNTFLIAVADKPTLQLLVLVKEIQRLQIHMKIGIFISHVVSHDDLHDLFQWFWKNGIVNVFVAFYPNCEVPQGSSIVPLLNIFTYTPFGNFSVINVTASETFDNLCLKQNVNFQRHPIRLPIIKGKLTLDEEDKLWENLIKILNASVIKVYGEGYEQLDEMIRRNLIDCSSYSHVVNYSAYGNNMFLYPMSFAELLIVVPEAKPYPKFLSYLQSVMSDTFCVYSLIVIVLLIFILTIARYVQQKKMLFFGSAVDVLNLIMNDNGAIKYQKLSHPEVYLIVPLTFVGLIVMNGVISILKSYLTRPVMQPQINTLEDIYNSPYPILAKSGYWGERIPKLLTNLSTHENWNNKICVVEGSDVYREISTFNTSISFILFRVYAKRLMESQKRLSSIRYHIPTQVSLSMMLGAFVISENFPFMERLNEIIHWMRNAGLYEKWEELQPMQFNVTELGKPDVETFPIPTFIVYGWSLGCIVFVVEIVWKKISCRKCQQHKIKV